MNETPVRVSVIIPSCNRRTLRRAIRSARWASELIVAFDALEPPRRPRGCVVLAAGPSRNLGGDQRNAGIRAATGTHLAFIDDDDAYVRGAGRRILAALEADPDRVHVFSMRNGSKVYSGPLESGFVGTPMFVVPREPVAVWSGRPGQDHVFIKETMRLRGDEPVFHNEIVAVVRPLTPRRVLRAALKPRTIRRVFRRWLGALGRRTKRLGSR
jgi:glycosyltransferase involved in cell wall biosynthesis